MKRLLIAGAGGHGRSVAEAVLAAGQHELIGFADDAALLIRMFERLERWRGLPTSCGWTMARETIA